ncbi:MAG: phosphatase PAP2 family protein, partial [Chthoniobacteraceae bacterium]
LKLLFLINRDWTSPALDSFMATLSCFAAWVPFAIIAIVLLWVFGGFKARAMLLSLAVVIAVSNTVVSDTIKKIVNRPRPRDSVSGLRVVDLQPSALRFLSIFKPPVVTPSAPGSSDLPGHSFPSGHTINNFSAAMVFTLFYRRRGWLYFIPAALVAYSRIYVGAHWPGDVVTSAFLGMGVTLLVVSVLEWAWRKYAARWMPALHALHPSLLEGTPA